MNGFLLILTILALPWQPVAVLPGWHVVGASIEPGMYYTVGNECETVAYSDYWTPYRGLSVRDGWATVRVRENDYAFYTSCPLTKYDPRGYGIALNPHLLGGDFCSERKEAHREIG